ncbi:MAG: guanylate kinase [Rhodothermales bacterium]|nr:guanylate kinase [Rhodothermales bacterium]
MQPCIIVLTAASGSGKTTLARRLLERVPSIRFSVSATTREPRDHETDGVHYHFMSAEEFEQARRDGRLLESEEVYPGRWYGTLRSEVENSDEDAPVLLDIDVVGAQNVKELYGENVLSVFIRPPSLDVLRGRLSARQTETEESLLERIERARMEIQRADRFDAAVLNDDLDEATEEVVGLVREFLAGNRS